LRRIADHRRRAAGIECIDRGSAGGELSWNVPERQRLRVLASCGMAKVGFPGFFGRWPTAPARA